MESEAVIMKFRKLIHGLNNLARSGWMIRGIPPSSAETVSQHIFTTSLLTLLIAEKITGNNQSINVYRAVAIALIHDILEGFTGDISSPIKEIYPDLREKLDEKVLEKINSNIIHELYREYLRQESIEAKIVKLCDYLATYLQAKYYYELGFHVEDIMENTMKRIKEYVSEIRVRDLDKIINSVIGEIFR